MRDEDLPDAGPSRRAPVFGTMAQVRFEHPHFGRGSVVDVEAGTVTVLFDDVGYRTLDREIVEDMELLREA